MIREYNLIISEHDVVTIANQVIEYLEKHPEDYVDCLIRKVISDKQSHLSWEFILDSASTLQFPLVLNGEKVDQLGFIRGMFELREKLAYRVEEHVTQVWDGYNGSRINDPDRRIDLKKILSLVSKLFKLGEE